MAIRPAHLRRRGTRGGAAVELLLSVPFLFLFSVATFDFVRGIRTGACAERAARHLAYCASRHSEADTYPDVPSADAVRAAHFYDTKTPVTVATSTENLDNPVSENVETFFELLNLGDDNFGRGVVGFLTGRVSLDDGTASQPVKDIRLFPSATASTTHKVSLRSRPEADPGDPIGWFDPFDALWSKLKDIFG